MDSMSVFSSKLFLVTVTEWTFLAPKLGSFLIDHVQKIKSGMRKTSDCWLHLSSFPYVLANEWYSKTENSKIKLLKKNTRQCAEENIFYKIASFNILAFNNVYDGRQKHAA